MTNTMFCVSWKCECCKDNKRPPTESWISFMALVEEYQQDPDRLRHLESVAIREIREKETKKHAKELTKYLNFEDIEDFT